MDNPIRWNMRGVFQSLHQAEVVNVFFRYLGRGLIVDFRHDDVEGPNLSVDTMAAGADDRVARIKRQRPRFAAPENVTLAPWNGSVSSFETRGGLDEVRTRLRRIGWNAALKDLDSCYRQLLDLERDEAWALIRGEVDRTQTLYQR
ncbi:MAG TPA: hypothetical protein VFS62_11590 [Chloroflexota bacterium]|nr:hypothetical protein [Chloroflexota bacterium]